MDTLTVKHLAASLQEPKVPLLRQVLRTLGPERCALFDDYALESLRQLFEALFYGWQKTAPLWVDSS
jgi:hypothetical protein